MSVKEQRVDGPPVLIEVAISSHFLFTHNPLHVEY